MTAVIKVENLSKQYRLGVIGSSTIKDDLQRWWYTMRGRQDLLGKVSVTKPDPNPASSTKEAQRSGTGSLASTRPAAGKQIALPETILALDNVSFQVQQGEILGIIGRNGAGKSTLLKILSRVTAPTTGHIKVKGRIASLLEVGTGFHPELTGRENVFLNGAILGMNRAEVARKFDEIVAFSEIEKFIDTPVKRYSSGMYVRLAFAVAAHLEPEILIVDEVLAVGDASFQRKCIGKMGEVSKGGRTVLFVSHSMTAVTSLCSKAMLIQGGRVMGEGPTQLIVSSYIAKNARDEGEISWPEREAKTKGQYLELTKTRVIEDGRITPDVHIDKPISLEIDFRVHADGPEFTTSIQVYDKLGVRTFCSIENSRKLSRGLYRHTYHIPANLLNDGLYTVSIFLLADTTRHDVVIEDAIAFTVHEVAGREEFLGTVLGCVRPNLRIEHANIC